MEFDDVINEHLELRRRNAQLEPTLPLDRNRTELTTRNGRPPKHAEAVPEETEEFSPDWLAPSEAGRNRETTLRDSGTYQRSSTGASNSSRRREVCDATRGTQVEFRIEAERQS